MSYKELIEKVRRGELIDPNILIGLGKTERSLVEEQIILRINEGDMNFYRYIPILQTFNVGNLMNYGHQQELDENNWLELCKNVYLRQPSSALLDDIVRSAKTNPYALQCVIEISQKRPDIKELPMIIRDIQSRPMEKKESKPIIIPKENPNKRKIVYFKIISGVIVKIDRENFTAYRFNQENKEWQEDSVLFTEYEHGNLDGEEFETTENFPYGEPFHFGRRL